MIEEKDGIEELMNETIEYNYSVEFAKKITREYIWRTMGGTLILSAVLGIVGTMALLSDNTHFFVGVALTVSILYIGRVINYERSAVAYAKTRPNQLITVAFDDDGMTYNGTDFTSIVKWGKFQSVTKLKSAWLFSTDGANNYAAIPSALITDTIRTLIEKKIEENRIITK